MTPTHALVIAVLLLPACSGGPVRREAALSDPRLSGEWEIVLTPVPAAFAKPAGIEPEARGTIAFVLNLAGSRVTDFNGIPQQVGTHNLRLGLLAPELDPRTESPAAAGSSAGDSVHIVIDPGSRDPVLLRGRWQGSGVTGEWTAHHRAGIDQAGRFTLRRPAP